MIDANEKSEKSWLDFVVLFLVWHSKSIVFVVVDAFRDLAR